MKIKKIMSVMLSMLCSATLTLPSLAVPATAEGNVIIEETTESESVLSESSTYIYTTDVQTTTSDFETTYTTTPDPGMIVPTTTTAVIEDLDFPFVKPVELKIIFVNKDKGEWMKNVSLDLKTTRKVYDEKGKTIDSIVTTEKLNTGDEGFVLYKTNCEMLSKYEEYSFIATPEIPEGFRITSQYSIIYINGVEIERNGNVLSQEMKFNLTEKEDPFANTGDPFGTGIYGTTTTTTYATTTTTTTTTSTNTTTTTTTISTDTVTTTEIKTEPAFEKCDFNSDGLINGEDAYLLAQRYMEIGSEIIIIDQSSREKIDSNGDLNADNLINMADARLLMDYISENNIVGDVNCDGVLDSRDASDILSYYVNDKNEQSTSIDYGVIALGDYDRNGVVDARDASAVLTYYVTSDNK